MHIKECGNIKLSPHQKKNKQYIYAFWHSGILLSVYFFRNKGINVLVSLHKDGEYISRVINKFGFRVIRGSTSRGGLKALLELKDVLNKGFDVAITPDGPRGPKQRVQMGIIYLAKITGLPLAPFSFNADKKKVLNSWDNFIIPLPFSQGVFMFGEPIYVSKNANEKEMEEKRLELENELNRLTEEAKVLCK
ncbi:MAG: lysophospholipid acyltransferase family protein [Candidatus Firestonebacteria bacterium]